MPDTIDYGRGPAQPTGPKPSVLYTTLIFVLGVVPLALGSLFAYLAWLFCSESGRPGFSWGPGFYVINMLQAFVYFSLVAVPYGAAMVLVGVRRLRWRRSGST